MLQPLPLGIGMRYVRAGRRGFFVSFISWVSLLGVCLGVAALITVLSVMNGFEGELRSRLLALTAHATLPASPDDVAGLAARAAAVPGVVAAEAVAEVQGLAGQGSELAPVLLRGAEPGGPLWQRVEAALVDGRLPGGDAPGLVLGRALAVQLGLAVGDAVTLLLPRTAADGALEPLIRSYPVSGLFELGLADHDAGVVVGELGEVLDLAGGGAIAGVQLRFADPFAAPVLAPRVAAALGAGPARDWTQEHAAYFRAIRLEKVMMAAILLLIVAVAAFNIVAGLVMVVNEKRGDIAILRTLGLPRAGVVLAFLVQGAVIGWAGALAGVALGLALALNVGDIIPVLERAFGFELFAADVYYITRVPSEVQAADVLLVAAAALVMTLLATIYPSRRAAATDPAAALRYE